MDNVRNIVRLKDIPSNIIEEAIIILKQNKKVKKYEYSSKFSKSKDENDDEKKYVIKEAELIISEYLKESDSVEQELKKKNRRLKVISACLGALFLVSIIL